MNFDELMAWAETIPMDELYAEIRKRTGLSDISFSSRVVDSRGVCRIKFSSDELIDNVPKFLKLIFSSIEICEFGSEVKYNKEHQKPYWWGSATFNYKHPGGGSNGYSFLVFWYKDGNWTFEER